MNGTPAQRRVSALIPKACTATSHRDSGPVLRPAPVPSDRLSSTAGPSHTTPRRMAKSAYFAFVAVSTRSKNGPQRMSEPREETVIVSTPSASAMRLILLDRSRIICFGKSLTYGERESSMNRRICQAIRERRVLEFTYDGLSRRVEPHCHGRSQQNNEVLRAYQVGGASQSGRVPLWRLFTVNKANGLALSNEKFSGTRPGYNPNDKGMTSICCNL